MKIVTSVRPATIDAAMELDDRLSKLGGSVNSRVSTEHQMVTIKYDPEDAVHVGREMEGFE